MCVCEAKPRRSTKVYGGVVAGDKQLKTRQVGGEAKRKVDKNPSAFTPTSGGGSDRDFA